MKITLLELENFAAIYVGLRRNRLRLDFSKLPNIITLIIGDMGSGKTTILSQLHPWSSIGTLDERNSDQLIRSEMDGIKHIVFKDTATNDEISITHKYMWNKDHHSVKSSFVFNGEELNPNGNQSSFKELVTKFMGIDQSYLRITRIGPNVSNLIDMGWGERKSYIASMIQSADIYADILAKVRQEMRTTDAMLTTLTKQLMNVTDDDVKEMNDRNEYLKKEIIHLENQITNLSNDIQSAKTECEIYLAKESADTPSKYSDKISSLIRDKDKLDSEIDELRHKLDECGDKMNLSDILTEIGKYTNRYETDKKLLHGLELQMTEYKDKYDTLISNKRNMVDTEYIKSLDASYKSILLSLEEFDRDLKDFTYKMSSSEIKNLLSDLQLLDQLMFDVFSSEPDIVKDVIKRGYSSVEFSKTQIEKLQYKLIKVKNSISNIKFIESYDVKDQLTPITDPACENCPYYRTHPNVIKSGSSTKSIEAQLREKMGEMDDINHKIDILMEYPSVYARVKKVDELFSRIKPLVQKLGALKVGDLSFILSTTSSRVWYEYDQIILELTLVDKYERRITTQNKMAEIELELNKYKQSDIASIDNKINEAEKMVSDTKAAIESMEKDIDDANKEITRYNELLDTYNHMDSISKTIDGKVKEVDELCLKIAEMNKALVVISKNVEFIDTHEVLRYNAQKQLKETMYTQNELESKLHNIEANRKEISSLQRRKWLFELIKDASSPQSGIPLIYVQLFLNDCINVTNDLISMVLDDNIELLDIDLNKPDFKIPYKKSDAIMEDVKSASQGERAAISLAISFALISKCMEMQESGMMYNILLLDEVDAPFYKDAREKFLAILAEQIRINNIEQVFLISHNNCYDGYPINIIATTDTGMDNKNIPSINLY